MDKTPFGMKMYRYEILPERKLRVSVTFRAVGKWKNATKEDMESALEVLDSALHSINITKKELEKSLAEIQK